MTEPETSRRVLTCDVCRHTTDRSYVNPVFLGRPDIFCFFCFVAWYEEHLVHEEAIRRRSMQLREEGVFKHPRQVGCTDVYL